MHSLKRTKKGACLDTPPLHRTVKQFAEAESIIKNLVFRICDIQNESRRILLFIILCYISGRGTVTRSRPNPSTGPSGLSHRSFEDNENEAAQNPESVGFLRVQRDPTIAS